MIIQKLQAKDDRVAIELWNVCLPEDTINADNFYCRIICDVNFDPELYLLAINPESNEPMGFVYGTMRRIPCEVAGMQPENAWVVAMGVAPKYRRKGVGTKLLSTLHDKLKSRGIKKVDIGTYTTNYFFPGVDQKNYTEGVDFLKTMGYSDNGVCASMDLNLREYRTPEKYLNKKQELINKGYTFGNFKMEDCLHVFDFLRQHFPYWLPNVRENIVRGRGQESIQLAWDASGQVVGFAMRAMDGTPGRFGPFGVASSQQGTGLGGILFHNLVTDMIQRRIFYTWFLWTGGRNLDIYATWGMERYREYTIMGRDL